MHHLKGIFLTFNVYNLPVSTPFSKVMKKAYINIYIINEPATYS